MNIYINGSRWQNKQGLWFEVIDYRKSKEVLIRFDLENCEKLTNVAYLEKGLPMHSTFNKGKIGDIFKDSFGNDFKLTGQNPAKTEWSIEWIKDGVTGSRSFTSIKEGTVRHPTDYQLKTGEVFKANNGQTFEVVVYHSAINVDVKFEDGSLTRTSTADIRSGNVGHPTSHLLIGQEITTNSGWRGNVEFYKNCYEVGVRWQDGSLSSHPASHIHKGGIKPAYQPSVCDIGYFGSGRFVSAACKKGEKVPDVIYKYWSRMITRCYSPLEVAKRSGASYLNTEIDSSWFNFHNFAEWALSQPNWDMRNDLDKDLLGTGSEYSAQNCTFLPPQVNIFLADAYGRTIHDLPKGVQCLKPRTTNSKTGYVARVHTSSNEREYLGYFDCPHEAHQVYKKAKEKYAKEIAELYKHRMTEQAYQKLKEFTI